MMAFSPVDRRLVTGAMENDIRVWDGATGEVLHILRGNAGNVMSCRFSEDGRYVLAGYADSTARIWNARTGELVTTLANGHRERIRDIRLSPDGTRVLTWAMDDKAVVWDLSAPRAQALLRIEGESLLLQARWISGGETSRSRGRTGRWSSSGGRRGRMSGICGPRAVPPTGRSRTGAGTTPMPCSSRSPGGGCESSRSTVPRPIGGRTKPDLRLNRRMERNDAAARGSGGGRCQAAERPRLSRRARFRCSDLVVAGQLDQPF